MNEKLATVTATDAVMKFWFVTPRLILMPLVSPILSIGMLSSALGTADRVLNWQLS